MKPILIRETWSGFGGLNEQVHQYLTCDALAVGLLDPNQPRLDELLAVENIPQAIIEEWINQSCSDDPAYRQAGNTGVAVSQPGRSPLSRGHMLMVVLPESLYRKRMWWLAVGRRHKPFNEEEKQSAELLVQSWRATFNRPDEANEGRIIIGHDNRLIHADPRTAQMLVRQPDLLENLLGRLHPIIVQRWPSLEDNTMRDLAVELAGQRYWIRFRRENAIHDIRARHWYLELRPLADGELPVVGLVDDERITRAIAYIHDQYDQSPSLSSIAQSVHVSSFHFHRMFSKQVGVSPKHYVQAKQLQVAKWLLQSSREPIGAIARRTGYTSHGHFTSTFHRVVGISPSEYRDKH